MSLSTVRKTLYKQQIQRGAAADLLTMRCHIPAHQVLHTHVSDSEKFSRRFCNEIAAFEGYFPFLRSVRGSFLFLSSITNKWILLRLNSVFGCMISDVIRYRSWLFKWPH